MTVTMFSTEAIHGENAAHFQGRKDLIKEALKTLKKKSQTCVIFGERGIGKTSLAWQIITTIERTNQETKNLQDQLRLESRDFVCVLVKDLQAPDDLRDLLVQCIAPSRKAYSLFRAVPEVYGNSEFLDYIKRAYDVDLNKVDDLVVLSKTSDTDETIRRLFDDVMEQCRSIRPDAQFLFFVDETDKMKKKGGLGQLIKNTNVAKFVFIGIADSIEEIILDHPSAARKLIGGGIEVPTLTADEIRSIFNLASREARSGVSFSPQFLSMVVKYSGGFPWIAQHVGDQATSDVDLQTLSLSEKYVVSESHFTAVWPKVRGLYSKLSALPIDWRRFEDEATIRRVADALIRRPERYLTVDEIMGAMGNVNFNTLDAALARLVELNILFPRPNDQYRFVDPIIRSFCIEAIERVDGLKLSVEGM